MLINLKFGIHNVVPEDGLLCKTLFFPAGLSKPEVYISRLKANRKSAAKLQGELASPVLQFKLGF